MVMHSSPTVLTITRTGTESPSGSYSTGFA